MCVVFDERLGVLSTPFWEFQRIPEVSEKVKKMGRTTLSTPFWEFHGFVCSGF